LPRLENKLREQITTAEEIANIKRQENYNLVRYESGGQKIALLNYPDFTEVPFPSLRESWLVDIENSKASYRTYSDSLNPPILHRKELLLLPDDPRREEFLSLSTSAESIGLFDEPNRIGYQRQWFALIREKGYRLDGYALIPVGNDESEEFVDEEKTILHDSWEALRHKTALKRYVFSAPVQSSPVTLMWIGNDVVPPRDRGDCKRHPLASMVYFNRAIASPEKVAVTVHHQENSATDSNVSKSKTATSASSLRPRINSRSA
jgi:hypothetical protein